MEILVAWKRSMRKGGGDNEEDFGSFNRRVGVLFVHVGIYTEGG